MMWPSVKTTANRTTLAACFVLIVIIALIDRQSGDADAVAMLYFIPLCLLAMWFSRAVVIVACLVCTVLHGTYSHGTFGVSGQETNAIPYMVLVILGYGATSLTLIEITRIRKRSLDLAKALTAETTLCRQGESSLRAILDGSPISLILLDATGKIRMANDRAVQLLRLPVTAKGNLDLGRNIPGLRSFLEGRRLAPGECATLETRAWRGDGEPFLARIWLSSCQCDSAKTVAAAIVDVTEDVREIEMSGLRDLMCGSRVVLGAMSHEIRNLAGAIRLTAKNLSREVSPGSARDLATLDSLSEALEELAGIELRGVDPRAPAISDLRKVLEEVCSIAEPELLGEGTKLMMDLSEAECLIRGDHHGIVLAILNIVNNAVREIGEWSHAEEYVISVSRAKGRVLVRLDTGGPGVLHPEWLFLPFDGHARGTGLGLYVSRTLLRSFGGDLRYETAGGRPAFVLELAPAAELVTRTAAAS